MTDSKQPNSTVQFNILDLPYRILWHLYMLRGLSRKSFEYANYIEHLNQIIAGLERAISLDAPDCIHKQVVCDYLDNLKNELRFIKYVWGENSSGVVGYSFQQKKEHEASRRFSLKRWFYTTWLRLHYWMGQM